MIDKHSISYIYSLMTYILIRHEIHLHLMLFCYLKLNFRQIHDTETNTFTVHLHTPFSCIW